LPCTSWHRLTRPATATLSARRASPASRPASAFWFRYRHDRGRGLCIWVRRQAPRSPTSVHWNRRCNAHATPTFYFSSTSLCCFLLSGRPRVHATPHRAFILGLRRTALLLLHSRVCVAPRRFPAPLVPPAAVYRLSIRCCPGLFMLLAHSQICDAVGNRVLVSSRSN
jgi:hypothetical protein